MRGLVIEMKTRRHIYFSGTVQGVGFRYRAMYAARSLGLTGWVRNLWDERVEMEVQGDLKSINLMLRQMEEGHFIHSSDMETEEMPIDEREGSFHIIG